ncbi:hypothetical protein Bbelb_021860 [Branchiostoma belcheri]|nr:hypothetical protein Bbelb_021860 [Branchiostoma belcheri]
MQVPHEPQPLDGASLQQNTQPLCGVEPSLDAYAPRESMISTCCAASHDHTKKSSGGKARETEPGDRPTPWHKIVCFGQDLNLRPFVSGPKTLPLRHTTHF